MKLALLIVLASGFAGAEVNQQLLCSTAYGEVDIYIGDRTALVLEGNVLEVEHTEFVRKSGISRRFAFNGKSYLIHIEDLTSLPGRDDYLSMSKEGKKITHSLVCSKF